MSKIKEKEIARSLRRKGESVNVIAKTLSVSKSSVSVWCRDIVLTKGQRDVLRESMIRGTYYGRMKGAEMNRKKKENRIRYYREKAKEDIGMLSKRDLLVLLVGLYWGEGAKTDNRFIFSNSDPQMVAVLIYGLQKVWNVRKEDFICRVLINKIHEERNSAVLQFWSNLLNLPPEQFRSTTFIKTSSKKRYENHNRYYGTLKVSVRRSSHLQSHFMGLIGELRERKIKSV